MTCSACCFGQLEIESQGEDEGRKEEKEKDEKGRDKEKTKEEGRRKRYGEEISKTSQGRFLKALL